MGARRPGHQSCESRGLTGCPSGSRSHSRSRLCTIAAAVPLLPSPQKHVRGRGQHQARPHGARPQRRSRPPP
ncbi:hypothetical protein NDU88_000676 [Pleurodeles waltl]|uniref:Uncharacterized protein n=1 Tax=Pleurodeles waltl TaxID=8319 RepID=A0AAV7THV8_PLEWA|nr:hypothetical protein NDU88_000676 [Pleurodeles waltl]